MGRGLCDAGGKADGSRGSKSNNKIRISEGEAIMQGRHWRVKPSTYEEVTIENGMQNMNRKDAIVARYTKRCRFGD